MADKQRSLHLFDCGPLTFGARELDDLTVKEQFLATIKSGFSDLILWDKVTYQAGIATLGDVVQVIHQVKAPSRESVASALDVFDESPVQGDVIEAIEEAFEIVQPGEAAKHHKIQKTVYFYSSINAFNAVEDMEESLMRVLGSEAAQKINGFHILLLGTTDADDEQIDDLIDRLNDVDKLTIERYLPPSLSPIAYRNVRPVRLQRTSLTIGAPTAEKSRRIALDIGLYAATRSSKPPTVSRVDSHLRYPQTVRETFMGNEVREPTGVGLPFGDQWISVDPELAESFHHWETGPEDGIEVLNFGPPPDQWLIMGESDYVVAENELDAIILGSLAHELASKNQGAFARHTSTRVRTGISRSEVRILYLKPHFVGDNYAGFITQTIPFSDELRTLSLKNFARIPEGQSSMEIEINLPEEQQPTEEMKKALQLTRVALMNRYPAQPDDNVGEMRLLDFMKDRAFDPQAEVPEVAVLVTDQADAPDLTTIFRLQQQVKASKEQKRAESSFAPDKDHSDLADY